MLRAGSLARPPELSSTPQGVISYMFSSGRKTKLDAYYNSLHAPNHWSGQVFRGCSKVRMGHNHVPSTCQGHLFTDYLCGAFLNLCALVSPFPVQIWIWPCPSSRVHLHMMISAGSPCFYARFLASCGWVSLSGLILLTFRFIPNSLPVRRSLLMRSPLLLMSHVGSRMTVSKVPASVSPLAPSRQTLVVFSSSILVVVTRPFLSIPFFGFVPMGLSQPVHGFCNVSVLPSPPQPFLVTPCVLVVLRRWLLLACRLLRFRPLGIGPPPLGSTTLEKILLFCRPSCFMAGQFMILLSPLGNLPFSPFLSFSLITNSQFLPSFSLSCFLRLGLRQFEGYLRPFVFPLVCVFLAYFRRSSAAEPSFSCPIEYMLSRGRINRYI